jgi:hypothetical protein
MAIVLFVVYIGYPPLHLLAEPHWHDTVAATHAASVHSHAPHEPAHDGPAEHHAPHPASEHSLQFCLKQPSAPFIALLAVETAVVCEPASPQGLIPIIAALWSPGESPPSSAQPRAPPIA